MSKKNDCVVDEDLDHHWSVTITQEGLHSDGSFCKVSTYRDMYVTDAVEQATQELRKQYTGLRFKLLKVVMENDEPY